MLPGFETRCELDGFLKEHRVWERSYSVEDLEPRQQAQVCHLQVRGTLGILERASRLGMTDFRQPLRKLEQTNFSLSPTLQAAFLQRNPE